MTAILSQGTLTLYGFQIAYIYGKEEEDGIEWRVVSGGGFFCPQGRAPMRIIALFLLCLPMSAGACPEPPRTVKRPPVARTVRRETSGPVYTF